MRNDRQGFAAMLERNPVSAGRESLNKPAYGNIDNIQYLRFIAASLVVIAHISQLFPKAGRGDLGNLGFGIAGVDIFFVISGFIMVVITQKKETDPINFFLHRLTRVAPLYWIMTCLTSLGLIFWSSLYSSSEFTADAFLASIFFIPWPHHSLHRAVPLLQVGWTLNYEFFFYALFALAMAIAPKWRIAIVSAVFFALTAAGVLIDPPGARASFLTSSILLEFVYGMFIARLYFTRLALVQKGAPFFLLLGIAGLSAAAIVGMSLDIALPRALIFGVPGAFLVAGMLGLNRRWPRHPVPLLKLLGDASYSVYLTHVFTVGVIGAIWKKLAVGPHVSDVILLSIAFAATQLVGVLVFKFVETPLISRARALVNLSQRGAFAS